MFEFELPEKLRRYVPLLVWLLVALVLLAIPLKIIGYGYLPGDDAAKRVDPNDFFRDLISPSIDSGPFAAPDVPHGGRR